MSDSAQPLDALIEHLATHAVRTDGPFVLRSGKTSDWYIDALGQLAREVMYGINRACVINPVNSVATILLATSRQSIEIEELISQAELYDRLIRGTACLASIRIEGALGAGS